MPDDIKIFKADLSLKKKLAPNGNAKDLFPAEVIKECQGMIEDFKGKFFTESATSIDYINESLRADGMDRLKLEDTMQQITALKGRAESLGFLLIARLLTSLQDYLDAAKPTAPKSDIIIGKHLESLTVAMHQAINDDGGAIGRDLLNMIGKLKDKIAKQSA